MAGASRFIALLTNPFPPVLHRPTSIIFQRLITRRISTTATRHLSLSHPPANCRRSQAVLFIGTNSFGKELHAEAINSDRETTNSTPISSPIINHPWPEWSRLLDTLLSSQWNRGPGNPCHEISAEDAFVVYEEKKLSDEFIHHASICLKFSRSRPELLSILSRKDMEVIAANGTPFLFKSALDVSRRLRAYLGMEGGNVSEQSNTTLADIMKYILSYASNPSVLDGNSLYSKELVESSARNFLRQMIEASFGDPAQKLPASEHQFNRGYEQNSRLLRQNVEMKRGDWICQKCNFMNFARNLKCLECEESRPHQQLTGQEWQCPQCNFNNYGRNLVCLRCDCKRPAAAVANNVIPELAHVQPDSRSTAVPEIAPVNKFKNTLPLGTRKSALEQQQVDSQSQKSLSQYRIPQSYISESSNKPFGSSRGQSLGQILGQSSPNSTAADPTMNIHEQNDCSQSSETSLQSVPQGEKAAQSTDFIRLSERGRQNKYNNQAEESKNWFQRVAELHNIKDLPTVISDEEFPEIMPMRKGENRFVVSKKKDRSLTSPENKRFAASGKESNSNFVPFVPFPPGYFASKDTIVSVDKNSSDQPSAETLPRVSKDNAIEKTGSQEDRNSSFAQLQETNLDGGSTSQSFPSSNSIVSETGTRGYSGVKHTSQSMNSAGVNQQLPNQKISSSWSGKSLEGSAVKEPNSLDMSEEAKAERWFRRVAQIKDISELSQIPDEDFPSIMPMRKGVNRFVVSKRKTPLERRLTSSQYGRNLPTVTSDPMKKENDTK